MKKLMYSLFFSLLLLFLSACSTAEEPTETSESPSENTGVPTLAGPDATLAPTNTPTEITEAYPSPLEPTPTTSDYPAPQVPTPSSGYPAPDADSSLPVAISFFSTDGTQLSGTYYPPLSAPAPVVVLMHQAGSDQHQWDEIALWLQTGKPPAGNETLPPMQEGLTFAVFTFDFRGHGESDGNSSMDSNLVQDAQSAISFAKTQPGVDPLRVITIGTSIGADAAVDGCLSLKESEIAESQEWRGCLGALSLSPGSFIGINYTDAANTLLAEPHRAVLYCLAAEEDGNSPDLCNSVTGDRFHATIYSGNAHGAALLSPDSEPNTGQIILEFLLECLQQRL